MIDTAQNREPCAASRGDVDAGVERALAQAVDFLRRVQLANGEFQTEIGTDASLSGGEPDSAPFVTTFVLHALKELGSPETRDLETKALDFLERERRIGGMWRYYSSRQYKHRRVPPDLDDTACATYALREAGRPIGDSTWLFRHLRDEQGRFLTWVVPNPAAPPCWRFRITTALERLQAGHALRLSRPPERTVDPRLLETEFDPVPDNEADPVVNANVILLLGEIPETRAAVEYLLDTVPYAERGRFSAYYRDEVILFYAAARAYRRAAPSLGALRGPVLAALHARHAAGDLLSTDLSAAMTASILIAFDDRSPLLAAALDTLLRRQAADGAWERHAFYSGPSEFWGSRELTTALCIEALAAYRNRPAGDEPEADRDAGGSCAEAWTTLKEVLTGPGGVDARWYLARYPEAGDDGSAAAHYARRGWREGKDPGPHFSTTWYLTSNPDVAEAGLNPLLHYLRHGRAEGRPPREPGVRTNPDGVLGGPGGVDAEWYLARYPEAAAAGSAAAHYARQGWREGKDPGPHFSTTWYLTSNADIDEAGLNPLLHYLRHGRAEGRPPREPEARTDPDGVLGGPGGVDADWYLARYPEAADYGSAAAHYARQGWREGKDPGPHFSTAWYLASYPDIDEAGLNPLLHYLQHGRAEGRVPRPKMAESLRTKSWWPGKMTPVLAIAVATALKLETPLLPLLPLLVLLTVAVAACACFVSVINDLTDIAEDAMCGKPNAAAGRPRLGNAALLLACGAAGLAFAGLWWGQPLALVFYFASWVSFSLYSLPPVRLKTRGLAGVFADGCGAHLFPALLGVTLVFGAAGRSPDLFWLLGAAVWSLAYGLRGIIGHQLADDANDARAGVDTYVRRRRREHVLALCSRVLLPLEVGALAVLMASLASPLPILAVVLYALFSLGRPQESRGEAALQSTGVAFYGAVLPLTLLTAAAISRPMDALVAVAFVAAFFAPLRARLDLAARSIRETLLPRQPTYRLTPGSKRG